MYPEKKFNKPNSRSTLLATLGVLIVAFIIIIALVFLFSAATPSFLGKCIAVVNLDKEIVVDSSPASIFSLGLPGSEEIAKKIGELDEREDVGAILIVLNSPGGSVVATREIYNSVKDLKKPKVAYFREIAASGAYYISSGTDYIISDPDAITGSIGVIATFNELSGLLGKVGVNATPVKSGLHKDIGSPTRARTDEEQKILQSLIDEIFSEFKGIVIENRKNKLDNDKFSTILDGRIVSGRQAKDIGLVDALGTKKDAIKKAASFANISEKDPRTCEISLESEKKGLFNLNSLIKPFSAKKMEIKFE